MSAGMHSRADGTASVLSQLMTHRSAPTLGSDSGNGAAGWPAFSLPWVSPRSLASGEAGHAPCRRQRWFWTAAPAPFVAHYPQPNQPHAWAAWDQPVAGRRARLSGEESDE